MGSVSVRKFILTVWQDALGSELAGEPATTPEEVCEVWGEIVPLAGNEYLRAQQMESTSSHQIRTEYFSDANPRMRLKHGARTFEVQSVVNVEERNRELEWMCTEVV